MEIETQFLAGTLRVVQVFPVSVEMQTAPLVAVAASLLPSAEQAMEVQYSKGAVVAGQVAPEFVET
jgi:hypothetical protein